MYVCGLVVGWWEMQHVVAPSFSGILTKHDGLVHLTGRCSPRWPAWSRARRTALVTWLLSFRVKCTATPLDPCTVMLLTPALTRQRTCLVVVSISSSSVPYLTKGHNGHIDSWFKHRSSLAVDDSALVPPFFRCMCFPGFVF